LTLWASSESAKFAGADTTRLPSMTVSSLGVTPVSTRLDTAVRVTRHSKRLAAPFSADPVRITFNMAAVEPESKPTESNRQRGTCDWRQLGLGSQVQPVAIRGDGPAKTIR